ncbi:MAG TPA: hypothetical protein VL123_01580 [Candidatus Udaeobacter sp.]|jgi:hypothetical protein|nr:hypothetical protein [Candidatus Udaeobacter sp.]
MASAPPGVVVRRIPYPWRAMMAICSDLDETLDAGTYFESMRFLNGTGPTAMGQGVGLEVGNSIYFDMAKDQFSYWNASEADRERIRVLIRSGHIDCLHSYGDLADTRAHAARALDELRKHECQLRVWVDHAVAPTNLGPDIMRGYGDQPGHPAYHADLTLGYGIQYLWRGRVTSVVGQDCRTSFAGIWDRHHPLDSCVAIGKEAAKHVLGRLGHPKYQLHAYNRTIRRMALRDGSPSRAFLRCNPHPRGVHLGDRGDAVHEVLTRAFLDRLVARQGNCILYTHLGKLDVVNGRPRFGAAAVDAFTALARYDREDKILVTTTRRMLDYRRMVIELTISLEQEGDVTVIRVGGDLANEGEPPAARYAGLTLLVDSPGKIKLITRDGSAIPFRDHGPTATAGRTLSVPWPRLRFPDP